MALTNQTNSENFEKLASKSREVGEVIFNTGLIESGDIVAYKLNELISEDYVISPKIAQFISSSLQIYTIQEIAKEIYEMSKILSPAFKKKAIDFDKLKDLIHGAFDQNNKDLLKKIGDHNDEIFLICYVKSKLFDQYETIIEKLNLCANFNQEVMDNDFINKAGFCTELNAFVQLASRVDNELNAQINIYLGLNSELVILDQ